MPTVQSLHASLERVARRQPDLPPPQVVVRAPGWDFESGDVDRPFHAASVGKVMTATLIAMLIEGGSLDADTSIGRVLPGEDIAGLPAAPGTDTARDVTVEHLLTHTSGLPDYFEPPRGSSTAASTTSVAQDPQRRWTPQELLAEVRHLPPVGRPGERFSYGDTAYVLLGRIAEEVTGEAFSALLASRIYERAGMTRSSTPYGDARTPEDLADLDVQPFWIGPHELSRALAVSLDWAGGGIVAPAEDLIRFQEALHGEQLVSRSTLAWMARRRHRMRPGIHYGAGLVTVRFGGFFPLLRGLPEPIGGLGSFATHMFYYPQHRAHVVLNFHADKRMQGSFQTHIRIAQIIAKQASDRGRTP